MTNDLSRKIEIADRFSKVPISSLAELTGFPSEFIKKELLLEDPTSMQALRVSMARYLNSTFTNELQ